MQHYFCLALFSVIWLPSHLSIDEDNEDQSDDNMSFNQL